MPELWEEIDALLFLRPASKPFSLVSVRRYREITGCGINTAIEAIDARKRLLVKTAPERFASEPDHRQMAIDTLSGIRERIRVIEGYWEEDSHLSVCLSAIVDAPSIQHPKYRAIPLIEILWSPEAVVEAESIGKELASIAGVPYVFDPRLENLKRRWWDSAAE